MTTTGALIAAEIERCRAVPTDSSLLAQTVAAARSDALQWALSILPPDAPSPDRERVARIIEPMPWLREARGLQAHQLDAATKHASLVKADAILALTAADPIPIERRADHVGDADDMVLVPREPTEAMMDAGLYQSSHDADWSDVYAMWKDMVSAAPVLSETGWRDIATLEPGVDVLLRLDTGTVSQGAAVPGGGWRWPYLMNREFVPVGWQPLPAPPAKPSGVGG